MKKVLIFSPVPLSPEQLAELEANWGEPVWMKMDVIDVTQIAARVADTGDCYVVVRPFAPHRAALTGRIGTGTFLVINSHEVSDSAGRGSKVVFDGFTAV